MISWVKASAGPGPAYVAAFVVAAVWFVLAAWLVSRVKLDVVPASPPATRVEE